MVKWPVGSASIRGQQPSRFLKTACGIGKAAPRATRNRGRRTKEGKLGQLSQMRGRGTAQWTDGSQGKDSGSSQTYEQRPQGGARSWTGGKCNRPPLSRSAGDLQAQAGPQAHPGLHRPQAVRHRQPAGRGRRARRGSTSCRSRRTCSTSARGSTASRTSLRWKSSSSRWPRPTASAKASRTGPGERPASAPPCCRRPRSRGPEPDRGQAAARAEADPMSERNSTSPSSEPSSALLARSGWGMSPTTLPASLAMPAMASIDPLGLSA